MAELRRAFRAYGAAALCGDRRAGHQSRSGRGSSLAWHFERVVGDACLMKRLSMRVFNWGWRCGGRASRSNRRRVCHGLVRHLVEQRNSEEATMNGSPVEANGAHAALRRAKTIVLSRYRRDGGDPCESCL